MCYSRDYCQGVQINPGEERLNRNTLYLDPQVCTLDRSHLQLCGRSIDKIAQLLGEATVETDSPCTCSSNLAHALEHRHRLRDPRRPFRPGVRHRRGFKEEMRNTYQLLTKATRRTDIKTREEVVAGYSGAKRRHYAKCNAELREWGFTQRISFPANVKWGERNSRPRAIVPQAGKAKGTLQGGGDVNVNPGETLLIPILVESPIRHHQESGLRKLRNVDGSRQMATGRSLLQRASDIRGMWYRGGVCLSIDCKSFDGSQGWLAEWERDECLRNYHSYEHIKDVERCFRSQSRLNIVAPGLKSSIFGNRASGTAGTSVANKLVMITALKYAARRSYYNDDVRFYCDGDDTLIFIKPGAERFIPSWMRRLGCLGLETLVENVATAPEDVVFCRSKMTKTPRGWMLIKKPVDAFKTMCGVMRHFKGSQLLDYFFTMNVGYGILWNGVPVMGALSEIYGRQGKFDPRLLSGDEGFKLRGCSRETPHLNITREHRDSFARTFGIPVTSQLTIERLCGQIGDQMPERVISFARARKAVEVIYC